jgi:hypothetical protein
VTATGVAHLAEINGLTELRLDTLGFEGELVDGAFLGGLKRAKGLRRLSLDYAQIREGDFLVLGRLTDLEEIYLSGSGTYNIWLPHLSGLKKLRFLDLSNTNVSDDGAAWLKRHMPNVRVNYDRNVRSNIPWPIEGTDEDVAVRKIDWPSLLKALATP